MGTIAVRVIWRDPSDPPMLEHTLLFKLFTLFPLALKDTGRSDDIRIATRFHQHGIDFDLSSDRPYGEVRDTSITELAVALSQLFKDESLSSHVYVDTYILRAGEPYDLTPISTLPRPTT